MMASKKLGFGCMHLPVLADGKVDIEQFAEMADLFIRRGFSYFDTSCAYPNGKSEEAVCEAVVKRQVRERFTIAAKLPTFAVTKEESTSIFSEQMEKLGVDYVDYYLLDDITGCRYAHEAEMCGLFAFLVEKKKEGKVKHIGFVYHDTADLLERILTEHPEVEVVQIVGNYLDWDGILIQGRANYEVCKRHGVKVISMQPLKGGLLADIPVEAKAYLPAGDITEASLAVQFAASHSMVLVALSGMSTLAQVEENTRTMQDFSPMDYPEKEYLIGAVSQAIRKTGLLGIGDYMTLGEMKDERGVPYAALLEAYNSCRMQPNPAFIAELRYDHPYLYKYGIEAGKSAVKGRVLAKDGTDYTKEVKEAEAFFRLSAVNNAHCQIGGK